MDPTVWLRFHWNFQFTEQKYSLVDNFRTCINRERVCFIILNKTELCNRLIFNAVYSIFGIKNGYFNLEFLAWCNFDQLIFKIHRRISVVLIAKIESNVNRIRCKVFSIKCLVPWICICVISLISIELSCKQWTPGEILINCTQCATWIWCCIVDERIVPKIYKTLA